MSETEREPAAASAGDLPEGFAVGEYRIERTLGRGGMGAVYAARQPEIDALVAVKVLAAELSRDPRLVQRFLDEARAVNKIRHPNIIDIFAFGRLGDGRQYFVMEFLDGETLAERLARGPLPPTEARRLLLQICEALAAAHEEKIVHRDLKPENLWIARPRHGAPYAKILDFGIAKLMGDREASMATDAGVAMGTPYFMAPEQCRGEPVDHRVDIYAMGVILYRMWAGRLPFEGATFLAVVSQQITAEPAPPSAHAPVPARLERLILACLEKDPARRPQSARALAEELEAALGEAAPGETLPPAGSGAAPVGGASVASGAAVAMPTGETVPEEARTAKEPRGRRGVMTAVAVAGVALVVVGAVAVWAGRRPEGGAGRAGVGPLSPALSPLSRGEGERAQVAPAVAAPVAAEPAQPAAEAQAALQAPVPRARAGERKTSAKVVAPAASVAPAPAAAAPSLEERGFAKENPFR